MDVLTTRNSVYQNADKVGEELERVLRSQAFRRASRLKDLLQYVVQTALTGKSADERRTAYELFGKTENFSPTLDPAIRVQFGRLRARLARYYENEGSGDPLVIEIPRRSYAPAFRAHDAPVEDLRNGIAKVTDLHREAQEPTEEAISESGAKMKSVAVLPFANLTTDPKQDAFCDGLTEEISNALAAVPSVNVVASSSAFQFKGDHFDVRDVGRELGVLLILEGSVRVERGQARVSAQLARSEDGVAVWSYSFDGRMNGSLNTQKEMAHKILGNLPLGG